MYRLLSFGFLFFNAFAERVLIVDETMIASMNGPVIGQVGDRFRIELEGNKSTGYFFILFLIN